MESALLHPTNHNLFQLNSTAQQRYRFLTILFVFFILAGSVIGIITPAGLGWDFANFYDTGRRVAARQIADIYHPESEINGQPPQGKMQFWGTPISAVFYVPLSYFSARTASIIFKIENTLAIFITLLLLFFHNRRLIPNDQEAQAKYGALFTFLALIYQPFWTVYRVGGQTTPTVLLLLTIAFLAYIANKEFLSALMVVLAILIKPAMVWIVLVLAVVSGRDFLKYLTINLTVLGVLSLLVLGWDIHLEFLQRMLKGLSKAFPWFYNSSLYVTFDNFRVLYHAGNLSGWQQLILKIFQGVLKLSVIGSIGYFIGQARKFNWQQTARRHFYFLMALSFFFLFSQTIWEHYLSILFIVLIYLTIISLKNNRAAMGLIGAIFFFSLGQNLILINLLRSHFVFDTFPELILAGLFKSAPLILLYIFWWKFRGNIFQAYQSPVWHSQSPAVKND